MVAEAAQQSLSSRLLGIDHGIMSGASDVLSQHRTDASRLSALP